MFDKHITDFITVCIVYLTTCFSCTAFVHKSQSIKIRTYIHTLMEIHYHFMEKAILVFVNGMLPICLLLNITIMLLERE